MSLQEHLYSQFTIPDVLKEYIRELDLTPENIENQLHANKWRSYRNRIMDKAYLDNLRKLFDETHELLSKNYPDLGFTIEGRRKSLISVEKKILHYTANRKSLDLIRDFFAFRIILFGKPNMDLIPYCYKIITDIIEFAASKGFTPCERLPLMDVKSFEHHENDYFNDFPYRHFIKDYICFPKKNGYRSIHLVLVDTQGRHLEIQVRTLDMHIHNEFGSAEHSAYKKKYSQSFPLEREKIQVEGYAVHNGTVVDLSGVEKALIIFKHNNTF